MRIAMLARLLLGSFLTVSGFTAAGLAEDARPNSPSLETFDFVWKTIEESYYDPAFNGLDWAALREEYRPQAAEANDANALRPILNEMLGRLGESHFGVFPGSAELEDQALVEAAVELEDPSNALVPDPPDPDPLDEGEIAEAEASHGEPLGDYSGLYLRREGREIVISAVDPDSPAAGAGLRAGQRVRRIGSLDVVAFQQKAEEAAANTFSEDFFVLSVLSDLAGLPQEGRRQSLTVVNPGAGAREQTFSYVPGVYPGKMSLSVANLPSVPIHFVRKRLPLPQGDVLYLHFNIFLPELMGPLREAIQAAHREDDVGLIIDLRGNPGGIGMMANGLAGLLTKEQYSLGTMTLRAGEIHFVAFPQPEAFLGPVTILIDRMSGSTSEIFAAGLQEAGRARIVGRRSMGAALPSMIVNLPNGDWLQHAIANLTTASGRRVEGRGVIPDERVPLRLRKRFRGEDPDIDKALKWIQRRLERRARSQTP